MSVPSQGAREDPEEPGSAEPSPTFSDLYASARPGERDPTRLLLALCGAMAVVAMSICGAVLVDRLRLPSLSIREASDESKGPRDREKLLRDVLEGQRQASLWDPSQGGAGGRGEREEAPRPDGRLVGDRAVCREKQTKRATQGRTSGVEAAPQDGVDPDYAALWGSGERYAAIGRRPLSEGRQGTDGPEERRGPSGIGTVLPARLLDRVAGTPVRAPVIATLARRQRLGDLRLPAGTEVHGTVAGTGSDDTRIFLDFDFLLLRDGQVVPIQGVARDPQGRHGIPARRLLGRGAVGSIGLSSASRAAREVGRHLAGRVGDAVGAGLEGATDSAADKSRRVDRDEHVLVAEAGFSFSIYVLGRG